MDNRLSEFFHLLREAQDSSDAVDDFDVASNDSKSLSLFQKRQAGQAETSVALIRHVLANGEELIASLSSHLGGTPEQPAPDGGVLTVDTTEAPEGN